MKCKLTDHGSVSSLQKEKKKFIFTICLFKKMSSDVNYLNVSYKMMLVILRGGGGAIFLNLKKNAFFSCIF